MFYKIVTSLFIIHIHSNFNFCKYNLLLHLKRFNWIFPTHFYQFSRLLQGIALTNQVNIKNLLCGNGITESNVLDRLLRSIPCYCISSSCLLKKYPILELSPHPFKTRVKYSNISLPKGFQSSLYILHLKTSRDLRNVPAENVDPFPQIFNLFTTHCQYFIKSTCHTNINSNTLIYSTYMILVGLLASWLLESPCPFSSE